LGGALEHAFAARGETLSGTTLAQMEAEWQRVKGATATDG
jgi:hypothetical protein